MMLLFGNACERLRTKSSGRRRSVFRKPIIMKVYNMNMT